MSKLFVFALLASWGINLSAAPLLFTFSGTFAGNLGPVHNGDTFTGTAVFDPNDRGANASFPDYAILTAFSFAMTPPDGFTIPSIPNPNYLFGGMHFTGPTFDTFQVNLRSTQDNTRYSFFLASVSVSNGGAMTTANFDQNIHTSAYAVTSRVIPEPQTAALMLAGLALFVAFARRPFRASA